MDVNGTGDNEATRAAKDLHCMRFADGDEKVVRCERKRGEAGEGDMRKEAGADRNIMDVEGNRGGS